MEIFFWTALLLLIYTWVGYPVLLLVLSIRRSGIIKSEITPQVTVLIAAYNEEAAIEKRIKNVLESDYPEDCLEILVASDGSTDSTNEIVASLGKEDSRIVLFEAPRGGKSAAQNRAIPLARGEIIVLTDAGATFNRDSIRNIVKGFSDQGVGCVSGRLVPLENENSISESQGLYWRYEMLLRRLESRRGMMHTATGAIMAFRKGLFRPFECHYGDDCILPLDILLQGYRVVHSDEAIAYDTFPSTMKGELRARTRMTLRNLTCTLSRYRLLNLFRYPMTSVAIISHKILRWLTPYFMIFVLVANVFVMNSGLFYGFIIYCQLIFYLFVVIGFIAEKANRRLPVASQAFSFLIANVGFFLGTLKALNRQEITSFSNQH